MSDAQDIHGTVFKNGSATLLARVVGPSGAVMTQSDVGPRNTASTCSMTTIRTS